MSARVISRRPWQELSKPRFVGFGGAVDPATQLWPFTVTRQELHKYLMAVCDLHVTGTLDNTGEGGSGTATIDFKLTDVPDFVQPTELSRLGSYDFITKAAYGLICRAWLDVDGNVIPGITGSAGFMDIGLGFLRGDGPYTVYVDGSNIWFPFNFVVAFGYQTLTTFAFGFTPSALTLSVFGRSVPCYDVGGTTGSGSLTIDSPATGGFLTWGGLRDPDTGHFTASSL